MRIYTPAEKIQQARLILTTKLVFYGSIFLQLNVHEDPTCPTAWTDGRSMGYNPDFLGSLEIPQIVGAFVHECLHVIDKHPIREAMSNTYKANHGKWNRACDYAINPIVHAGAPGIMTTGPGWLLDMERWPDNLAEKIFAELDDDPSDSDSDNNNYGPGEVRPMPSDEGGDANDDSTGSDNSSGSASGVDSINRGLTPAEAEAASNQVDQWVQQAAMKAESVGQMTGGIKQLVKQVTVSTVDWTSELEIFVSSNLRDDFTWRTPNMRYMQSGLYLPSMTGQEAQDLVIYCDTSGSLTGDMLGMIAANIQDMADKFNLRVLMIYWDTKYQGHELFEAGEVIELHTSGRGGTSFDKCWKWLYSGDGADVLSANDIDPQAVVFFTDCECSQWPGESPGVPVLWCQVPAYRGGYCDRYLSRMPTEYGRRIKVPAV